MEYYTNKLIEIFAECDIDNLEENQDYIKLCHENNRKVWFDALRARIEKIKKRLEITVGKQSSLKNQVIEALTLLNRMKTEEEKNICYELIIKEFSNQWQQSQLDHFKKYYNALQNNYDYFLSFTDRNPTRQYGSYYLNPNYEYLTRRLLGKKFIKDHEKVNLLARAIHYLLESRGNIKGFFYPQKEEDNQEVKAKLISACEHCFVFVQIIQNIMFADSKDSKNPNYCHFEYCHACKCLESKKRFIFLLAEKSHDSLKDFYRNVHPDCDEWYQDILSRDKIILQHAEKKDVMKMIKTIRKNLVEKIDKIKWEIIEDVPD
ncbi:MAG: hypothetical protein QNJ55_11305 [Xenococcus sp. MO_188.B8]|nr:hypothetical protein [Xenococcus sp. MO_188.B8]